MNIRFLLFAFLLCAGHMAQAQVSYIQNIALPTVRDSDIIAESNAPLDTTNPNYDPSASDAFYLYTPIENYVFQPATSSFQLLNKFVTGPEGIQLEEGSQVVNFNRQADFNGVDTGPEFLVSGFHGTLFTLSLTTHELVDSQVAKVNNAPITSIVPPYPLAYGQNVTLASDSTQIYSAPNGPDGSTSTGPNPVGNTTFNPLISQTFNPTPTGTLSGSFSNITSLSFAPGSQGLLYVLDWGNQQVDGFSLTTTGTVTSATFKLSFKLPAGLTNNTTGTLGFTVDDFGHILIADGKGGGIEMDLQGNVIAIFDPPANDAAGINILGPAPPDGTNPFATPGDASFITYNSSGDIFVENGVNGLHEYLDQSAVPEPSTWALLGVGSLALIAFRLRKISS